MSSTKTLDEGQIEPARPGSKRKFTAWHASTVVLLALGYSGYYFCRSDLSVVLPDLIHDMARHGMTASSAQIRLGLIASVGTVAYALGKFVSGALADLGTGRRNFLGGMAGSIVFTIIFAMSGGFPIFTMAWIGNRLFQSQGWAGLVKVSSRWFSYSTYGTVMACRELEFSVWRRDLPMDDEPANGSRRGLARRVLLRCECAHGLDADQYGAASRERPRSAGCQRRK